MSTALSVEARFEPDRSLRVLAFTWQGRRRLVTSQGRQWEADDGRHVLVMVPEERVFELVFVRESGQWLMRRAPEGRAAA
jgi:hypothetical protein